MDNLVFPLKRSAQLLEEDPKVAKQAFKDSAAAHCPHCGVKHRSLTPDQCKDRRLSERQLQDSVVGRAKRRGWTVAHAGKGWVGDQETGIGQFVTPMAKGWPDLTLVKPGHHIVFMELKRELGTVEPEQVGWINLLNRTGNYAIVVRPSDVREGRVNAILKDGAPLG